MRHKRRQHQIFTGLWRETPLCTDTFVRDRHGVGDVPSVLGYFSRLIQVQSWPNSFTLCRVVGSGVRAHPVGGRTHPTESHQTKRARRDPRHRRTSATVDTYTCGPRRTVDDMILVTREGKKKPVKNIFCVFLFWALNLEYWFQNSFRLGLPDPIRRRRSFNTFLYDLTRKDNFSEKWRFRGGPFYLWLVR